MKTPRTAIAVALAVAFAWAAGPAHADEALAKSKGCTACHANDKKVIGPAYKEVAKKYKGDKKAAAMLAQKVKKGGQGTWGPVPMPPNPAVPDADLKAMVDYILCL